MYQETQVIKVMCTGSCEHSLHAALVMLRALNNSTVATTQRKTCQIFAVHAYKQQLLFHVAFVL